MLINWLTGANEALEKDIATHSSILAWEIPWTEEPGRLQSMESQESDMTEPLNHHHQDIKDKRIRIHAISACQPLEKHLSAT